MSAGLGARRLRLRPRPGNMRRAVQMLRQWLAQRMPRVAAAFAVSAGLAIPAAAEVLSARYISPTDAYGHGVLPGGEYAGLAFHLDGGRVLHSAADRAVYEDTAPRLVDLDGDGSAEVITVISYFDQGAALRIWDEVPVTDPPGGSTMAVVAETPPIGRAHRWLAVIGAADLDGDGHVEIAYIDRPHLARELRIWQFRDGELEPVARRAGLTNHRIGEAFITSGLRNCGAGPELVTVDASWQRIMVTDLQAGQIRSRDIGAFDPKRGLEAALRCR